jgi:hypothetical protein
LSDIQDPPPAKKPLGVVRGLFATLGIIVMVLTGGCALLVAGMSPNANDLALVASYAAIPFLVGLGIFLLATRVGR